MTAKIELTIEEVNWILAMTNVLNFPGEEAEKLVEIRKKFNKAKENLEQPVKDDKPPAPQAKMNKKGKLKLK